MEIKVFTSDNKMAFDWMINAPRDIKQKLLDRINGVTNIPFKIQKTFWHDKGIIYCRVLDGDNAGKECALLRIRGWGMLTGVGGYNLDTDVAAKIQDDFAEYCVKILNNHD